MNFLLILLIFCLVLFFYLHIYFQLKTSTDLEIYEIEDPNKERLEEICDLRQPVVFSYRNNILPPPFERLLSECAQSSLLAKYSMFDVKIRNTKDAASAQEQLESTPTGEMYVPLQLKTAVNAFAEDKEAKYFSENNRDFLEEAGIDKLYKSSDHFLRPQMTATCLYDYLFAAKGTQTPFRYELNYRTYFMVAEGSVKVKLTHPNNTKYLLPIKDYEYLEFRSPLNPWQIQQEYAADFEKIKCLEITLQKGQLFYLPAYWWYSFEFSKETPSAICSLKYRTYMNNIAICDKLFIHFLQSQNIKRKTVKTMKL
jgi:hypothetical protein